MELALRDRENLTHSDHVPLIMRKKEPKMLLSIFADEEFINSHHLLWRFVYSYISILAIRMRYYFAFKMGKKKII